MNENFLNELLKNARIIEPHLIPFQGGERIFHRCLERYIQINLMKHKESEGLIRVYCTYTTEETESFFDNVLFDLLFDPDYVYDAEFLVVLNEFSKMVGKESETVAIILESLSKIHIEMRVPPYEKINFVHGSTIFPGYKIGECLNIDTGDFDSEERYYKLSINRDFLRACLEVKEEMSQ